VKTPWSAFAFRVIPLCALLAATARLSLFAQAGSYLPPNPITPPVVTPPAYAPDSAVSPVAPPTVSGPEVSGVSVSRESGNGAARSAGAAGASPNNGTTTTTTTATSSPGAAGVAGAAGAAGTAAKSNDSGKNGKKALPKDLSSVSALSLLDLAGDNPLFGALTGSSAESGGIEALTKLLSGDSDDTGSSGSGALGTSGSAALQKAIALMAREKAARESSAGNTPTQGAASPGNAGAHTVTIPERVVSGGEIARFTVNGNDVAKSVTELVSSALARDGSFLLTGDRTYPGGDRWLTETFYLLCRKTGPGTYALYADLSQPVPNANSFLYRLARMTPIEGRLEGDLITFESSARDWRLDLAIRVFSASVGGKTVR